MTDDTTAERVATAMVELKREFPQMRMGQIFLMVAQLVKGPVVEAAYDVEDEAFLSAALDLLKRRRATSAPAPSTSGVRQAG